MSPIPARRRWVARRIASARLKRQKGERWSLSFMCLDLFRIKNANFPVNIFVLFHLEISLRTQSDMRKVHSLWLAGASRTLNTLSLSIGSIGNFHRDLAERDSQTSHRSTDKNQHKTCGNFMFHLSLFHGYLRSYSLHGLMAKLSNSHTRDSVLNLNSGRWTSCLFAHLLHKLDDRTCV